MTNWSRWGFRAPQWPWLLLSIDVAWTLYWLAVALYLQLDPDLYGALGAPYRGTHRWQMVHFATLRNTMWTLDEHGIAWWVPVIYAVTTLADLYNVLEVVLHIDNTGAAWTLEMVGTSVALAISALALLWTLLARVRSLRAKRAEGSRLLQRPLLVQSAYQ